MVKLLIIVLFSLFTNFVWASGFTFLSNLTHAFHLPEHVLTLIFASAVIVIFGMAYRLKLSSVKNPVVPDSGISVRNIMEIIGGFIYSQCETIIGKKHGPKYFSFIMFLFSFILLNNFIGLIPGFVPATQNLNTTLALGLLAFIYYNIQGCKEQGFFNYLKHFLGPLWYMAILIFPIEIISNLVRPLSLALRLRGNMFGDHLVLGIFSGLIPYVVPVLFLFLGVLVCLIQAFVFCVLTMVYISLAMPHHDHDEG